MDTRTEQERAREAKLAARQAELDADLNVAADLLGGMDVDDKKAAMENVLKQEPKTKDQFAALAKDVMTLLARHQANPLYPAFVEQLAKDLSEPLLAVQVRKVGSGLATLGNTKQQEERDKANGKKKVSCRYVMYGTRSCSGLENDGEDQVHAWVIAGSPPGQSLAGCVAQYSGW